MHGATIKIDSVILRYGTPEHHRDEDISDGRNPRVQSTLVPSLSQSYKLPFFFGALIKVTRYLALPLLESTTA